MNYYLGADIGTSGTKTVLFDVNGRVIASATEEYPLYQPENGYAEQEPADWANAVLHTIAARSEEHTSELQSLDRISVCVGWL